MAFIGALLASTASFTGHVDAACHWTFDAVIDGVSSETMSNLDVSVHGATPIQGALHGGLYFDGIDDYASVAPMDDARSTMATMSEGTISAWFRFDHNPGFMDIETIFYLGTATDFSSYGTSANCFQLEVGHFSAQRRLYWTLISSEGEQSEIPLCWSTIDHLNTARWYHIASSTSTSGTKVYLDGVELLDTGRLNWNFGDGSTCRFLADVSDQDVIWFGRGMWDNQEKFYEGAIDEVRLWNRAISEQEIIEEYERAAGTGSLHIDPDISSEQLLTDRLELGGTMDNIVDLSWRIDGTLNTQQLSEAADTWNLVIAAGDIPAGRHTIEVVGRNAARRTFIDSRIVVQPDLDGNRRVDVLDLLSIIDAWGSCGRCVEDLSGDGSVEVMDLLAIIDAWGDHS
tara:strand:- start:25 stop:1224 length:1200 start_codon:yes stop_codon:yes gene_type:complete